MHDAFYGITEQALDGFVTEQALDGFATIELQSKPCYRHHRKNALLVPSRNLCLLLQLVARIAFVDTAGRNINRKKHLGRRHVNSISTCSVIFPFAFVVRTPIS